MKAVVLAAGRGTRISRHINDKPKCTVPLDERTTLIEYSVSLLEQKGISDIVLVLGYRADVIRKILGPDRVDYRVNPFFDVTNSLASLWFARDEFAGSDRYLIMNGDVFLSGKAIDLILAETRNPVLFYDKGRIEEADYRFLCDGDRLVKYGKDLSSEETSGEYIGCATFGGEFVGEFRNRLDSLIERQQHSLWWENVLYSMTETHPINVRDVEGAFWGEVDYIEDYERIMEYYRTFHL